MQIDTKIGIHHKLFCGDNFASKDFKKLPLMESLFKIKQEYCLQTTTLPNCVTEISWGRSEIAALKTLKNYRKNIWCSGALKKISTVSLSLTLQPCSPEFWLQQTETPRELFRFEWSEIFRNFPEKGLQWSYLINYTLLLKSLHKLFIKFWKIIRKSSLVALFLRNSSCPVYPLITIPKTDSTANASFVCLFQEL